MELKVFISTLRSRKVAIALFAFLTVFSTISFGQNAFESALRKKMDSLVAEPGPVYAKPSFMPNSSLQSIMTPSGWGASGSFAFGVIGGVYPALYTQKADMMGAIGFCFGNSAKYLNVSVSANIGRVTELRDYSYNVILSRKVFRASSISVGGMQLFSDASVSDSPAGTYYIAFSHSSQTMTPKTTGYSPLTWTVGFGNGRFLLKSPFDVSSGKGKYGTGVFANISYEAFKAVNFNLEWSGMNLGVSSGFRPFSSAFTVGLGIYNLTEYSGDKPMMIASVGYPIALTKREGNRKDNRSKGKRI